VPPLTLSRSNDRHGLLLHHRGEPIAFIVAVALILPWIVTGPLFGWSDTWQLVVNTATTIVTFLMVFLIQNSQNRDAAAIQAKLDELIRAVHDARTSSSASSTRPTARSRRSGARSSRTRRRPRPVATARTRSADC
jgi:hypothetical protein